MKKTATTPLLLASVIGLLCLGCGGSGTPAASANPSNPTPPATSQDPAGIWIGTNTTNGSGTTTVIGACDAQGHFRYYASDNSVGTGSLAVTGATFTGSGTTFTPTFAVLPLNFTTGTLTGGTSLTAQWSAGGSLGGSLSMTFNALYNRPSTLASLAGTYSGSATSGSTPSLAVQADGSFSGTSGGGTFSGTLLVIDANKNLFRVSMIQAGENYSGLAFWADGAVAAPLAPNTLYVQVSNAYYGMAATLAKQ